MNRPYEGVAIIDVFFEMTRIMQKRLDHTTQFAGRFGTIYSSPFAVTAVRWTQLYHYEPAPELTRTARLTTSGPDVISTC